MLNISKAQQPTQTNYDYSVTLTSYEWKSGVNQSVFVYKVDQGATKNGLSHFDLIPACSISESDIESVELSSNGSTGWQAISSENIKVGQDPSQTCNSSVNTIKFNQVVTGKVNYYRLTLKGNYFNNGLPATINSVVKYGKFCRAVSIDGPACPSPVQCNLVASVGDDLQVCKGTTSINVTGTVSGGATSGSWTIAAGNGSLSNQTSVETATGSGVYTVSATYTFGQGDDTEVSLTLSTNDPVGVCEAATNNLNIIINALPIVSISSDGKVCAGSDITLTASGATSYKWSNDAITSSITVTGENTSMTYTVTGTDDNGCQATDEEIITVNALPEVSIASDGKVCIGSDITLTASGATSYEWSNEATTESIKVTGENTSMTYSVTGTDGNGCKATDSETITVNALPTVSIASDGKVCIGSDITLTASGATSYKWSNDAITSSITVTGENTSMTYTVTGTDDNGCQATDEEVITVNPLPTVIADDKSVCVDGQVALVANVTGGSWTLISGNGSVTGSTYTAGNAAGTASVTYTYTDNNGCINSDNATVNTYAYPVIGITGTSPICRGTSSTLNASGADSYSWTPGSLSGASVSVSPYVTTTYTVAGTSNGCTTNKTYEVKVQICEYNLALSQGFYGTSTGTKCIGGVTYKAVDLVKMALTNGGTMVLGRGSKTFTVTLADAANLVGIMPGSSTPSALPSGSWTPSSASILTKQKKISNVLLSQTITLWLNINLTGDVLENVLLSSVPGVPTSVKSKVSTVAQLLGLANDVLGGLSTGVSAADVNNALNSVVLTFDNSTAASDACSYNPLVVPTVTSRNASVSAPVEFVAMNSTNPSASALVIKAYPNPYADKIIFNINAKQSGKASLVLYNMVGQKVANVFEGQVQANSTQTIEYTVPSAQRNNLVFVFRNGTATETGKLVSAKK